MYKIKDYPHLVKDDGTKAVVNTDFTSYQNYIAERNYRMGVKENTSQLEHEINNLKSDMAEIKSLLIQLLGISKWP